MGKRQRIWARKTREKIFDTLGRKCVDCGVTKKLEFDLIVPADDYHHKIEWSWRMSFYRKQLELKNLAVRCSKCNGKKSNQLVLNPDLQPDQPF